LLARLRKGRKVDYARGVRISGRLMAEIRSALPRDSSGHPQIKGADFRLATFEEEADFREAVFVEGADFSNVTFIGEAKFFRTAFKGDTSFEACIFKGDASFFEASLDSEAGFEGAIFEDIVYFSDTTLKGPADFTEAQFNHLCYFSNTEFSAGVDFGGVQFHHSVYFREAMLAGGVSFDKANFKGWAGFESATFQGGTDFSRASFEAEADFDRATFQGKATFLLGTFLSDVYFLYNTFTDDLTFADVRFENATQFGPIAVKGVLRLDDAFFGRTVRLSISARRLSCSRIRFTAGGQLRIASAEMNLEEADFSAPFIISHDHGSPALSSNSSMDSQIINAASPAIISLMRANVAGLVLTDISLRGCSFSGAHSLDHLRVETSGAFDRAPGVRRLSSRQVIAEEARWRRSAVADERGVTSALRRVTRARWRHVANCHSSEWLGEPPKDLEPEIIASIYRALRKAREDSKDEPGAADFYYGEMEMRRKARSSPKAERFILWWYWALSGYGLRASRAFTSLFIAIGLFACLFQLYGFENPSSPFARTSADTTVSQPSTRTNPSQASSQQLRNSAWPPTLKEAINALGSMEAWTYSFGTATAIFTSPEAVLTPIGRRFRIALRIVGPVLLALAILSIRGRVKR
jgi:uncharacterized protein YjbI with pentapeptide repeats